MIALLCEVEAISKVIPSKKVLDDNQGFNTVTSIHSLFVRSDQSFPHDVFKSKDRTKREDGGWPRIWLTSFGKDRRRSEVAAPSLNLTDSHGPGTRLRKESPQENFWGHALFLHKA